MRTSEKILADLTRTHKKYEASPRENGISRDARRDTIASLERELREAYLAEGRIADGTYAGMTPEEVLADREAYRDATE